ncbi:hypothetical protein BD410DRAFT_699418, partial [Rickenella mellea]
LKAWKSHRDEYLDELHRLEGRGDAAHLHSCPKCGVRPGKIRCEDCFGEELLCETCCVHTHQSNPLHVRWNGRSFERCTLKQLGLRVQLGHVNSTCPCPRKGNVDFTIIHTNGVHSVAVDFCGCEDQNPGSMRQQLLRRRWFPGTVTEPQTCCTFACLKQFHTLTLQSKVSGYDYYRALECLADNTGINPPPERLKTFMRIVRQWRHLRMLKRAGIRYD